MADLDELFRQIRSLPEPKGPFYVKSWCRKRCGGAFYYPLAEEGDVVLTGQCNKCGQKYKWIQRPNTELVNMSNYLNFHKYMAENYPEDEDWQIGR